jgi:hypothetical protein
VEAEKRDQSGAAERKYGVFDCEEGAKPPTGAASAAGRACLNPRTERVYTLVQRHRVYSFLPWIAALTSRTYAARFDGRRVCDFPQPDPRRGEVRRDGR